jgi:PKD repeat protein
MKKAAIILLNIFFLTINFLHSQVSSEPLRISGSVFNASTLNFEPNAEIYFTGYRSDNNYEDFRRVYAKAISNDTGYFEIELPYETTFQSDSILMIVKNCDGWWKEYYLEYSTIYTSVFNGILLTICDSMLNSNINHPITFNPSNPEQPLVTDADFIGIMSQYGPYPTSGLMQYMEGDYIKVTLVNNQEEIVAQQFVYLGEQLSELPCRTSLSVSPTNDSELSFIARDSYKYDFFTKNSQSVWSINGSPFEPELSGLSFANEPGNYNVCLTKSLTGVCEIQKCDSLIILSPEQLCNADFSLNFQSANSVFLSPVVSENYSGSYYSSTNQDSVIFTIDGITSNSPNTSYKFFYIQQSGEHQVCMQIFRGTCITETCQSFNVPVQSGPENCILPFNYYPISMKSSVINFYFPLEYVANSVVWDFGDGSFSNEATSEHEYLQSGEYIVKLIATFENCVTTTLDTININVENACEASIKYEKLSENRYLIRTNALDGYGVEDLTNVNLSWSFENNFESDQIAFIKQYEPTETPSICLNFTENQFCNDEICLDFDVNSDTLRCRIVLQGFDSLADFSDSKFVIFEAVSNNPYDSFNDVGLLIHDTISVDISGITILNDLPQGNFGAKFLPGPSLGDTTIIPSYSRFALTWDQLVFSSVNYSYYNQVYIPWIVVNKRQLVDNYGTGSVVGSIISGPFKLSSEINFFENASLILLQNDKPVRYLNLNGNNNFQFNNLQFGAYCLKLDIPNCKSASVNFLINDENQSANISLNFEPILPFDLTNGLEEIDTKLVSENEHLIYPNPVQNKLKLNNLNINTNISIMDLQGIEQGKFQNLAGENVELDVSNLKAGTYFLIFYDSLNNRKIRRFVKF